MEKFSEEDKNLITIAFNRLKPVCDQLITKPNKYNANELLRILSETPSQAVQLLESYILLPIELHLRNDAVNCESKRYFLQCMKVVLQKATIEDFKKSQNLFTLLFTLIADDKDISKLIVSSEEFIIDVLECVTLLMTSRSVTEFYSVEMHPRLGFGVHKCVLVVSKIKANLVLSKAFSCLLAITQCHDECQSPVDKRKVAEIIKKMVPGIINCCSRTVAVGALQHHSVVIGAVRTWSKIICLVMKNTDYSTDITMDTIKAVLENKAKVRDEWTTMADSKLNQTTEVIVSARTHPHWRARLEVACACNDILRTCRKNFASAVSTLIETLIILSQDQMIEVSRPAADTLRVLLQSDKDRQIENHFEENLFGVLEKLMCVVSTNDDNKQIVSLHLLKGYLQCLGKEKLTQLLAAKVYVEQLITTLISIVDMETSHVILLENCAVKEFHNDTRLDQPWKLLRYFTDTKLILSKVEEVCAVLGTSCDVNVLVLYLLDIFENEIQNRRQISLILSMILKHAVSPDMLDIINLVLDTVLANKAWNVPLSVHTATSYNGPVADNIAHARCNIVQACLLCEVISATAKSVGNVSYRTCLFKCLYPLMERAGSQHELISLAGLQAIQCITEVCQYKNVTHLISENIDYLSHHVTIQLRQGAPLVLDVISVILQQANEDVLPCIEEILDHALQESPKIFGDQSKKISYFNMYLTFVTRIRQWYFQKKNQDCKESIDPPPVTIDYVKDLCEFVKLKNESENFEQSGDDIPDDNGVLEETNSAPGQKEPEKPKENPKHIQMVVSILNTCHHFLPSKTLCHQVLVLQILNEGIQILACYDEDVLLPLVHKIWGPLVHRFEDFSAPLVIIHAFNLLLTLADTSKEFIRARTLKEIIPSVSKFLKDSAKDSRLQAAGSPYRLTHQYKLQLSLLSHMGEIILSIGLRESSCSSFLSCVSVYLGCDQPLVFREVVIDHLLLPLMATPQLRFVVWAHLMSLWPEKQIYEPADRSQILKSFYIEKGDKKYESAVVKLYNKYNETLKR